MRNPNRLENFYKSMEELHKTYYPDLRFGQLICNFFSYLVKNGTDPFFPEENRMLELFKEYCEK